MVDRIAFVEDLLQPAVEHQSEVRWWFYTWPELSKGRGGEDEANAHHRQHHHNHRHRRLEESAESMGDDKVRGFDRRSDVSN